MALVDRDGWIHRVVIGSFGKCIAYCFVASIIVSSGVGTLTFDTLLPPVPGM